MVIDATEIRLSVLFPNRMPIENGRKTSKSPRRCSLRLQQASIQFMQHETFEKLAHNKEGLFLQRIRKNQQRSTQLNQPHTKVRIIGELNQHSGSKFDYSTTTAESSWEPKDVLQPRSAYRIIPLGMGDHGTRQSTSQVYAWKGKAVDEYEQMRQSIHDIDTERGSSYSQPSYYGELYEQQQYGDRWSSFSEQQHDTE
uniref:Uncharacterized protein n=1 Tax=Musa balbisiana TaxID=52838 RepID=Q1EP60_MUSBA|nr:hypothetical protein MBP_81C12.32 [Musa balbisiana]